LGPKANKIVAYGVASISGAILAVCSCSVLPMFAGIWKLGAGLGPACAFLYSGPAINILAIFLTARVLGFNIGLARAVGAIAFAGIIGIFMALIFRKEEAEKAEAALKAAPSLEKPRRSLLQTTLFFICMILFLVFSDWYNPGNVIVYLKNGKNVHAVLLNEMKDDIRFQLEQDFSGMKKGDKIIISKSSIEKIEEQKTWVMDIYHARWYIALIMGLLVVFMTWQWFTKAEFLDWMHNTWEFAKLLVPLLYGGVFVVGFISVFIPGKVVAQFVGDNSVRANFIASIIGAFWYFATLTEIPITEALMKFGMHHGPVLALLLAGPALSFPNVLVIGKIMGIKKTLAFCGLVVIFATITGFVFGML